MPRCFVIAFKIHKYIASSPVRSFNNLIHLVVERRFRLLFSAKSLYFENKKRETFNLPCNFLTYSYVSSGTRRIVCMCSICSDGFQLILNSRLKRYLDNFKLSTRDREEYTSHENFTVTANPRSIEDRLKRRSNTIKHSRTGPGVMVSGCHD